MPKNGTAQDPEIRPGDLLHRLGEVPDLLVTSELMLRPLAKGEDSKIPKEACEVIGEACDQLHMALTRVLEVLRSLPAASMVSEVAVFHSSAPSVVGDSKTDGRGIT